jgi:hypothetical protein
MKYWELRAALPLRK